MATKTKGNARPKNRVADAVTKKSVKEAPPISGADVVIPRLEVGEFSVEIVGKSPLLVHRFSEKARKQIEEKQQHKAPKGKGERKPQEEFFASMYIINGNPEKGDVEHGGKALHGIPAAGFKKAMKRAGKGLGLVMTDLSTSFKVIGHAETDLVALDFDRVERHDKFVRINQGKSADMRYRACYYGWTCPDLVLRFNKTLISPSQLINLLRHAGFSVGYGEWRMEKDGEFGEFDVNEDIGDIEYTLH